MSETMREILKHLREVMTLALEDEDPNLGARLANCSTKINKAIARGDADRARQHFEEFKELEALRLAGKKETIRPTLAECPACGLWLEIAGNTITPQGELTRCRDTGAVEAGNIDKCANAMGVRLKK